MPFKRTAIVMAGGSGTRFWPVSTTERPKQFLKLASETKTLLEQSVERVQPLVGDDLFVATSTTLLEQTRAALPNFTPERVFAEPIKRNTLGAIVWATAQVMCKYGAASRDLSLAILTSDHVISPDDGFRESVSKAFWLAEETNSLVTIGITPTRAATEYGYIEKGDASSKWAWKAERFREKPNAELAAQFVAEGNSFWNSGMFVWTLLSFSRELKQYQPNAYSILKDLVTSISTADMKFAHSRFEELESISIDFALMERATNVSVVSAEFEWDDVGSWDALARGIPKDERGNTVLGSARLVDSKDCIVYNDQKETRVNILGLDDVLVVATEGEIMVCPKSRVQDVSQLAD